jgi:hypothetical protein
MDCDSVHTYHTHKQAPWFPIFLCFVSPVQGNTWPQSPAIVPTTAYIKDSKPRVLHYEILRMIPPYLRNVTRQQLAAHTGDLSQVAGVRMMTLSEGRENKVKIAEVRTGSGLRFQITIDRGMDISLAEYQGIPLAWRSPVGDVHPSFFDPNGLGWQRAFPGGLMTGCGMTYLGSPCVDEGEPLGLHGRLSNLPATKVNSRTEWEGEECRFIVEGEVTEYRPFHEHLTMHRTIVAKLGESVIEIRDEVCNDGSARTPLMLLYHVNVGWPIVAPGSRLLLHCRQTLARDANASKGLSEARLIEPPQAGYEEQVFYHELIRNDDGFATALIRNETLQLGLFVRYRQAELPRFVEWKMMGEGTYVVGMEPANCFVGGRAAERAQGTLQFLAPGESRSFVVQIGIVEGASTLKEYLSTHNLV